MLAEMTCLDGHASERKDSHDMLLSVQLAASRPPSQRYLPPIALLHSMIQSVTCESSLE